MWRRMLPTVISIVVVNFIPIIGVLWLGWTVLDVMLSYWMETLIICFITFLKILASQKPVDNIDIEVIHNGNRFYLSLVNKYQYAFGFIWNSIILLGAHLLFIWLLFGQGSFIQPIFSNLFTSVPASAFAFRFPREWLIFSVALLMSHGYSFFINYYRRKEYLFYSPKELMVQPYRRVAAMLIVLMVGGWLINRVNISVWAVVALIVCKIAIDILAHLEQHRVINRSTGDDLVTETVRNL